MIVKGDKMIKEDIARLLTKSNGLRDPKRNLQLLEGKVIAEGWSNVPINGIYGSSNRTMLHMAVQADVDGNFFEVIQFLIQNGIDVNAKDSRGNTVLHYLSSGNNGCTDSQFKIAKLILDNGGNLNIVNNNNMPALRSTITHTKDNYRLMHLFLKYKINDETLADLERTARIVGNSQVVEIIEKQKAGIELLF